MNVISLSKNAVRELKYLPLSLHTINTEATIYKMKYQNQDKICARVNIFVHCERHMGTWINLIFVNTVL